MVDRQPAQMLYYFTSSDKVQINTDDGVCSNCLKHKYIEFTVTQNPHKTLNLWVLCVFCFHKNWHFMSASLWNRFQTLPLVYDFNYEVDSNVRSPLSLSLSVCPVCYFTKSEVFGIQKMFLLPEGDRLLRYKCLLTHSAVSLEALLYRIELSSR